MKKFFLLFALICSFQVLGQIKYITNKEFTIQGKAFDNAPFYHRIDTNKYANLPEKVKGLFTAPAGLYVTFKSNTSQIKLDWTTRSTYLGANTTGIMARGLDLYIKENGKWMFAGAALPNQQNIKSEYDIVKNLSKTEKEFMLYLPLWNEITDLKIGIDASANFINQPIAYKKKIVVYGSSIVQGASASRPGMNYPSILTRKTGYEFINLGLSGNAKIEIELAEMIKDIQGVDLFILDCVPNSSPEEIKSRTIPFVKLLRKHHPKTPILMVESLIRPMSKFDLTAHEDMTRQNQTYRAQYDALIKDGIKDLYLLKGDNLIGSDNEGSTDGIHPNDLGFSRLSEAIEKKVNEILSKK
ncbi:SGNH/GDSL hydrolase family protein [Empedobacter falsenii]